MRYTTFPVLVALALLAAPACSMLGDGDEEDVPWDTDIPESEDFNADYPAWGPDGKRIAFSHTLPDSARGEAGWHEQLWMANLETGERRMVAPGPKLNPDWSPDGQWLVAQTPATLVPELLFKVRADGTHLTWLTGAESINPDLEYTGGGEWSPSGDRIVFSVQAGEPRGIAMMRPDGSEARLLIPYGVSPSWFPSGERITYVNWDTTAARSRQRQIYLADSDGSNIRKLTDLPNSTYINSPVVSPNSEKIAFVYKGNGSGSALYLMDADGKNVRQVTRREAIIHRIDWHPDGKKILFSRFIPNVSQRIYILDVETLEMEPVFPARQ